MREAKIGGRILEGHGDIAISAGLMFRDIAEPQIIVQRVAFVRFWFCRIDRRVGSGIDEAGQRGLSIKVGCAKV